MNYKYMFVLFESIIRLYSIEGWWLISC
ncbi:unnamed protein product, partial [Vitis vinifera]